MHAHTEAASSRSHGWSLAWAILLVFGCTGSEARGVPDFVTDLPRLGDASSKQEGAMRDFYRDLEAWAARAGRPSSAEALLGPMFLRSSRFHSRPSAADTGLEAEHQRLEFRFAELLARGDSLGHAADAAHARLVEWTGRVATPAGESTEQFRMAVFPPPPADPGRGAVALQVKCSLITVKVLPSNEGVSICWLKDKVCTRMPADDIGGPWWSVVCIQSCFDYIGWVPKDGGFTVGSL